MTDGEKVIKELEWILADDRFGFGVNWETGEPRDEYEKAGKIITNTIALLKEQEPIEPVDDGHGSLICGNQGFGCGCVGRYDLTTKVVEKYCNFCPECGRQVKWE